MNHPKREFIMTFDRLSRHTDRHRVFGDWCEMAAIALWQPFYRSEKDEARYLELIGHYPKEDANGFAELLSWTALGLEAGGDFLGSLFEELDLGNSRLGQFFTPYEMSQFMARITFADREAIGGKIGRHGYITLSEPASGAGGMVLAVAEIFREFGFNPSTQLWVQANDVSHSAALMTYIQLALAGIPAAVSRMNTLSLEVFWTRYTPMYFFENWPERFRQAENAENILKLLRQPPAVTPVPTTASSAVTAMIQPSFKF